MRFSVAAASVALATSVKALNTVVLSGQDFVDSQTGARFEIIGVDYQPGGAAGYDPATGVDPLSNADHCRRDAALMQILGVNTIRSYNLNPDVNHDECVSIFNAAGIYILLDVNSPLPNGSIDRSNPADSYNMVYLNRTFALMDNFRGYGNVIGFFGANELVNDMPTAKKNPPYIRAVQRDLKQYLKARGGRVLPVGYSAADVREVIPDTSAYLQCQINNDPNNYSRSDFFGVNGYSWCGPGKNFQTGGYEQLTNDFANTTVPVFFSEYGCNKPEPRLFEEVQTIYGPQMTVFSGGLVYEWTQETENFGLVNVNDNNTLSLLNDFNTLRTQFAKIDLKAISQHNNTASNLKSPMCGPGTVSSDFSSNFDLPDQPSGVPQLIKNGVGGIQGKLIEINDLQVNSAVYNSTGAQIQDLKITKVSGANSPGSSTGSSGSSTSSGAASVNIEPQGSMGLIVSAVFGMLMWIAV